MILYHFTARHLVARIEREGVTRGGYIERFERGQPVLRTGYMWLTVNPAFAQSWCGSRVTIPYDRAAVRITVNVPEDQQGRVINWLNFCRRGGVSREVAEVLNAFGDPQNWRLFQGSIPPAWFVAFDRKCGSVLLAREITGGKAA